MSGKLRRVLACILLGLMAASVAACASPNGTTATNGANSTTATEAPTQNPADEATDAPAATDATPAADGEKTYDKKITISMNILDAEKTGKTERDKYYFDKFNVEFQFIPVTWGDWTEKVRAMVAADDIPDILTWDMKLNHTAEFRGWAQAGAFKEIPADLSKWPNLAAIREKEVSDDKMLTVDGKLYGWSNYRNNPAWMQDAYYPLYAYRRDWAKAVGMYKEGDMYTWDETLKMMDAVFAQDPGKNGANNTFGITSEAWAFPTVLMETLGYGKDRSGYVKTDAGFVPYFTTDAWRQEVKFVADLYRKGYIWKDMMVVGGSEGADNFFAGRSFMHLGNNSPSWFSDNYRKMTESGTIASTEDVGPMMVLSPADNKTFTLTQTEDYWTVSHMSYKVDDEKMERILDMWNWNASEDGRAFRIAGIPDKDYKRIDDSTIEILWPKLGDGSYDSPYKDTTTNYASQPQLVPAPNEGSNMAGFDAFKSIDTFMQTSPDFFMNKLNWDLSTFDGEMFATYGAFDSESRDKIKEILASKDDVDAMIDAWLKEMEPKWKPVADELNEKLK